MSVQALPSTPTAAEPPAARRSGSGAAEDARDVFALPSEADAQDLTAPATVGTTAEVKGASATSSETRSMTAPTGTSRVAFEAALVLNTGPTPATTASDVAEATDSATAEAEPIANQGTLPVEDAALKNHPESKPGESATDATAETATGTDPVAPSVVLAAVETQAVAVPVVPMPAAALATNEAAPQPATETVPPAVAAKPASAVGPAIATGPADQAISPLAAATLTAPANGVGETMGEATRQPQKPDAPAEGADGSVSVKPKDAAPAATPAAGPELKTLDALRPAEPIDLGALNLHAHAARGEALKVAAPTMPDMAAATPGQPGHGAGTAVPATPLHVVPIEIGLKALSGLNSFEIRLDPAELGRVDVKLDISDTGEVTAKLVVDRVETLHLLQRDARTLERAFEQAGLKPSDAGVDISLRDQGTQSGYRQAQQDEQPRRQPRQGPTETDDVAVDGVSERVAPRWLRLGSVDMSV